AQEQVPVFAPRPWEIGMQSPGGPLKQHMVNLNNFISVIIALIVALVGVLLAWVIYRYNSRTNPVPGRASHNSTLEIAWTVIPVVVLVIIFLPSIRLVYYEDRTPDPDLTIKVTGHQWYWEYTYPDNGNINFSSYIVPDDQIKPGQLRLLDVDNQVVLPV